MTCDGARLARVWYGGQARLRHVVLGAVVAVGATAPHLLPGASSLHTITYRLEVRMNEPEKMTTTQLRVSISDAVSRVCYGDQTIEVVRHGKVEAVLVNPERYERLCSLKREAEMRDVNGLFRALSK